MPNITTEQYIGESVTADESAILGYMTGRPIADHALRIGEHSYIRAGSIIYGGVAIGSHFQTGHNVTIREETTIGDHVGIWSNTVVDYGCKIGSNVKIHTNVYIAQFTIIEDEVFMAPGVSIANDMRPLCTLCTQNGGPTIKRGARLGVNVTVLPGVTIGEYALIGAGTVVTKDVPAGAVVIGNPGRVVKQVDELGCPTDPDNCQGYVNMMDRNTQIEMGLTRQ